MKGRKKRQKEVLRKINIDRTKERKTKRKTERKVGRNKERKKESKRNKGWSKE